MSNSVDKESRIFLNVFKHDLPSSSHSTFNIASSYNEIKMKRKKKKKKEKRGIKLRKEMTEGLSDKEKSREKKLLHKKTKEHIILLVATMK